MGSDAAAAAGLLSTGTLAEGSGPLWETSGVCLQRGEITEIHFKSKINIYSLLISHPD